ncbi:hypothetical protein [Rhodococcus erythropolis]|uniref:hypothetical protein n=1 Tax=Rhodococcus erythropolis TaxID=1833 RepID=UPI0036DC5026
MIGSHSQRLPRRLGGYEFPLDEVTAELGADRAAHADFVFAVVESTLLGHWADAVVVEPVLHPAEFMRDFRVVVIVIPALAVAAWVIVAGGLGATVTGEFDPWMLFIASDRDCV